MCGGGHWHRRGDPHQPVNPLLGLQIAVGVGALDREGHALGTRFLAGLVFGDFGLEALALAPAQVHTQQHFRPILGFGAAGTGIDADDGTVRIVHAGEHAGEFHAVDLLHQGRQQFTHLVEGRLVLPSSPSSISTCRSSNSCWADDQSSTSLARVVRSFRTSWARSLSFQKSGLATSASSSATRSRLPSRSKTPPQLGEPALELRDRFQLFTKTSSDPLGKK